MNYNSPAMMNTTVISFRRLLRDQPIVLRHALIGVPIWAIGGLAFGKFNHWMQQRNAAKDPGQKAPRS